jgi:tetratricopeptide (TPR) repeat protein
VNQQALADSLTSLGNLLRVTDRQKEAETAHREALAVQETLVRDFPNQPDFRRGLGQIHNNLGNLLSTLRPADAEAPYRAALVLREKLAADFPNVPDDRAAVAATLDNLAKLYRERGDFADGLPLLAKARPHLQAALGVSPGNPTYRLYYRNYLYILAECQLGLADHTQLATTADELARFGHQPAIDSYNAACWLCHCVTLAGKDAQLVEAKRKELAQRYADLALAQLRQSVARGYKDAAHMKQDTDLEPLRAREEFRKLLADLEGKKKE